VEGGLETTEFARLNALPIPALVCLIPSFTRLSDHGRLDGLWSREEL